MQPLVGVLMGSKSDWPVMEQCTRTLEKLGVPYEVNVISAHRAPDRLAEYAATAEDRGLKIIIAAAGLAAHLPGVTAAKTALPVLGVPMESQPLGGVDALLSIVQMPAGIPVGTLAIGKAGAKNAAILAAQILALNDPKIKAAVKALRAEQTRAALESPDPRK
jgi:5-(carboxyamino)imidazole ribonucleotide mutase